MQNCSHKYFRKQVSGFGAVSLNMKIVKNAQLQRLLQEKNRLNTCNLIKKGFISDINDCLNVSCKHGGTCTDGINNFSCFCRAGYTGIWCETGGEANFLVLFIRNL